MSDIAIAPKTREPAQSTRRRQVWPKVVITFGIGLSVAWPILLGYGMTKLIEMVI